MRGVVEVVGGGDVKIGLADDLLAEIHIGAFEPHHQRHRQPYLLDRRDHAFGDDVAFHDAAENIDQNALHLGIGSDDLEGGRNLLLAGTAADVEKVGRRLAVEPDDIHRRHGQPGAVDHAADGAVQRDVVELVFRRLDLLLILLAEVAQGHDVGMAEERVVVEADLGIEADELVALGDDERIDLEQAHILGDERGVELRHHCRGLLGEIVPQPQRLRQQAPVMGHDPRGGIDRESHDLLGMGARDLLDVHAAGGRSHEGDARRFAVDQRREIELAVDRGAFFDIEAVDLLPVRAGLMGHQDGADQALGLLAYVLGRLHDLDAAGLAAPTGMDLRLDDDDRRAEILCRLDRLLDRESGMTARHRHAELPQHRLGLIFVDVHRCSLTCPGYDAA